ncbi:MAG: FAD-dependent oxidoreductase [Pirellulaceae bacterium]
MIQSDLARSLGYAVLGLFLIVQNDRLARCKAGDELGLRKGDVRSDFVIYGLTSAGVMAAVEAKRLGNSVVLVGPEKHLGGLTASGLGWTDTGNKVVIGGLAREFYQRVWQYYQRDDAWGWQSREQYGNRGQGTTAIDGKQRTQWIFEPHVAEAVFEDFVRELDIPVFRESYLDRANGVEKAHGRIRAITMLDGKVFAGRVFMDATYEGDLMAASGVQYHVGRESNEMYEESWNGVQVGVFHHKHWFHTDISAYKVPGVAESGLLPRISRKPPGKKGAADRRIQAYCYRMCLTNHPPNRLPFPKPNGYDSAQYELLLRVLEAEWQEVFNKFDPIPNFKTDTNNHGPFSTDNIGMNYDYPQASYERREEILQEHVTYQQGLMYFLANDPRVPSDIQKEFSKWGLAKDEFTDNGGWPHQIYVREARRMLGKYIMTEHDILDRRTTPKPIGMGSYTMDSHNVQRYVTPEGFVQNEGDVGIRVPRPYEISYDSLVPKSLQCENLLVPVCVSSSHIAFGSIRMEPVFMILGQSAAMAGTLAIENDLPVQEVPYDELSKRLKARGQILSWAQVREWVGSNLPGIVVDDTAAVFKGPWSQSASTLPFIGFGYVHDSDANKGECEARFESKLVAGTYLIRLAFSAHGNRASNVELRIQSAAGDATVIVDQKNQPPEFDGWFDLGKFYCEGVSSVTLTNRGTDGHVIADAVQWLPVK